jgi:DNA polymerase-1
VNYLIQGSAADIFKQTVVDLDRAGLAEHLILPVHDEAVFDVPEGEVEEVARAVVEVFEADRGWTVPLTAGSDILDRWGDKYA